MLVEVHDSEHGYSVLIGLVLVEGRNELGELLPVAVFRQVPARALEGLDRGNAQGNGIVVGGSVGFWWGWFFVHFDHFALGIAWVDAVVLGPDESVAVFFV